MKHIILVLFLLPMLSFGQLTDTQQKVIETYTLGMCDCVNNVVNELHPSTIKAINYMAENGADKINTYVEKVFTTLTEEEQQEFLASFEKMETPEFANKLEACDTAKDLEEEYQVQLENSDSDIFKLMLNNFETKEKCKIVNLFYKLGTSSEQD